MRHLVALALLVATPVLAAPCPRATGDLAPGTFTPGAPVARWSPQGDGRIDVADVVANLRETVGLQMSDGPLVGGDCPSVPGDLAPGTLDMSTVPPTWRPRGDGHVDVADVIVSLRASTGQLRFAPLPARSAAQLQQAAGCEDLAARLRTSALAQFDRTGSWGGGWWWNRWGGGPMLDGGPMAGPAEASAGAYSSTNVQEQGVDEADVVKTDGSLLLALSGQSLRVLRAWPVQDLALLATVPIEGWPSGVYLDRGHAVVISQVWAPPPGPMGMPIGDLRATQGLTKLTVLDLSDPSAPRPAREVYIDGWLQASRQAGSRTVLVIYHALAGPPMPDWTGDETTWRQAVRNAIAASTVEDWLPLMADVRHPAGAPPVVTRRFAVDCASVRVPPEVPPAGLVSVMELDAVNPGPIGTASIAGTASTVYVSPQRVVVGMDDWIPVTGGPGTQPVGPDAQRTRLHAFALGGPDGAPRYLGAGVVPGWVGSPFSIDEEGTTLRVATTTRDAAWVPSTNVFVLQPNGTGDLAVTGSVTGLAPGQTLQSARFLGDRGYLVTFERRDPLFVLDLADPAAPRVTGELHVTGWSSYLHPLPEHRLIGIGREVDPQTLMSVGMQVSLFDVANPAAPALSSRCVEPIASSGSEAEWDHHAFNWFAPLSTLAVPLMTWGTAGCPGCPPAQDWNNSLRLYRITPAAGVQPAGAVELNGALGACAPVRRSVFLGDDVLAVTDAGVAAAAVAAPGTIVSSVIYPDWPGCGGGVVVGDPGGTTDPGGTGGSAGGP